MLEKIRRGVIAAAACSLLLAAGGQAQTVTTTSYDATSTSENIAESCAKLSVSTRGVLEAECNAADVNGDVSAGETSLTLPDHLGCERVTLAGGTQSVYDIRWGSGDPDLDLVRWSVATTGMGNGYTVSAGCKKNAFETYLSTPLSLSDTTSGLKNDAGELEKR